ncbi:hemerythrin domain-containing protein [Legionella jamestowniensis]|uniref:DNA nickase n=1 Tax=Legionella jamestowniensis TaxID=455 RepID=A0A0W0UG78_9GAMM|nr:hemerythrin domain-containing protein [Legionella jamestowniensis]KTD06900.1 DNA nickase [Legionella jamestowniensis]SFL85417.1 Hemerythrin HHE cation binding domain-containing protein [Legionella jamestowniensis DSM 19215]
MDIYDYLKMDHAKVSHLFQLFEKSESIERQQQIVALISKELLVHAHAEQETFYKYLAQHPATKDLAEHGKKEHVEIEEQIGSLNGKTGKTWQKAVLKLKDIVDHHVNEEGKIFRKAKKVLSENEALIIKEKMHYLKGKFLIWLENQVQDSMQSDKEISELTKKTPNISRKDTKTSHPKLH